MRDGGAEPLTPFDVSIEALILSGVLPE